MAQRCMFFDPVSGDRSYDATSLAALLRVLTQRDGVVYGYGGAMQVNATEPASMNVSVATGAAFVQGRLLEVHTAAEILGITAADPTLPRIDRVTVKLDNSAGVRSVVLAVKAGTAAASPTPPTLQRDGTVWELSLAQVYVAAGATSIEADDITDERDDEDVCGYTPSSEGVIHRGTVADGTSLSGAIDALYGKFDTSSGHDHDGMDSKRVDADKLDSYEGARFVRATSNANLVCVPFSGTTSSGSVTVTFGVTFDTPPTVLAQIVDNTPATEAITVYSITTTQCTVYTEQSARSFIGVAIGPITP